MRYSSIVSNTDIRKDRKMTRKIAIFDTTLRDGEQSPGASMNSEEKLVITRQLLRLNVDVIEAGFPVCLPLVILNRFSRLRPR